MTPAASPTNKGLVPSLVPAHDGDCARARETWPAAVDAIAPFFRPDSVSIVPGLPGGQRTQGRIASFRAPCVDRLAPWATYRSQVDLTIDRWSPALALLRTFGPRDRSHVEAQAAGAAVWTIRDGWSARLTNCRERATAPKAARLKE